MKNIIGFILMAFGLLVLFFVIYNNSRVSREVRPYSPYTLLSSSWEKYKVQFLNKDGRIIDYSQNSITTSEGQSYALLRAVFIDDKTAFDNVWNWTKDNLQDKKGGLFGWKWGQRRDKSYGFLENGGQNSAGDADSDIALALIFASSRWHNQKYLDEAKKILTDLWDKETAVVNNKRFLIAGNWAKNGSEIVINPSYFAPYAWRIFAKIDKKHDWNSLIGPAYNLLLDSGKAPLDKEKGVGLPPDWLSQNSRGLLKTAGINNSTTDYSLDAQRVPWRIALDYFWNKDPKAKSYLLASYPLLLSYYQKNQKLAALYSHDGKTLNSRENPVMYSTLIGYLMLADPKTAARIYQEKIIKLYSNDQNSFNTDIPYYEQNWLWFGAAMYNNYLQKL